MAKKLTMTEALRAGLAEAPSFKAVERATGVSRHSLMRFARGDQSLRLDIADELLNYLNVEVRRTKRGRARKGGK